MVFGAMKYLTMRGIPFHDSLITKTAKENKLATKSSDRPVKGLTIGAAVEDFIADFPQRL